MTAIAILLGLFVGYACLLVASLRSVYFGRRSLPWPMPSPVPPRSTPPPPKPTTYRDDARGGEPCPTCGRRAP